MIPPCDHTGTPGLVALAHFHSSTTSGAACLMSLRIRLSVSPRQSPSSAIRFEMRSVADWVGFALDFFMFLILPQSPSRKFAACRRCQETYDSAQSTAVTAAQLHACGPSPTEK